MTLAAGAGNAGLAPVRSAKIDVRRPPSTWIDDCRLMPAADDNARRPSTQVGYGESSKTLGKSQVSESVGQWLDKYPPDLRKVIEAWDTLADDVRKTIVGVVVLSRKSTP